MAKLFIRVPNPGDLSEKIAISQYSDGAGNTVDREEILIGSPSTLANLAEVLTAAPGGTEGGLVVRLIESDDTLPWRQALLDELRAVRLGIQTMMEYLSPPDGVPVTMSKEADLIWLAQSIRDGSEEVIT